MTLTANTPKDKKERLALKGKSIEQAQKDIEKYQKEADDLKKKYEENEQKIKGMKKMLRKPKINQMTLIFPKKKELCEEIKLNIMKTKSMTLEKITEVFLTR